MLLEVDGVRIGDDGTYIHRGDEAIQWTHLIGIYSDTETIYILYIW